MGQQLDLFTRLVSLPAAPAPEPPSIELAPPPAPGALPGQTGLFDDRSFALGRARAAVAAGLPGEACRELDALLARGGADPAVSQELAVARELRDRLARIDSPRTRKRAPALLAFARELEGATEPRASLRLRLLARVAAELHEQGAAAELEGRLAGEYLMDAGDLAGAEASLAAAAATLGAARPRFRLADVAFLRGEAAAARRLYVEALLVDPFDPALGDVRDEAVRALPAVARYELEIDDEPEAWAGPAGIVTGVLPRPRPGDGPVLGEGRGAPDAPRRREALGRARSFVEALAAATAAHGDAAIEARRRMKQLSPAMFTAYMERMVRGRRG